MQFKTLIPYIKPTIILIFILFISIYIGLWFNVFFYNLQSYIILAFMVAIFCILAHPLKISQYENKKLNIAKYFSFLIGDVAYALRQITAFVIGSAKVIISLFNR